MSLAAKHQFYEALNRVRSLRAPNYVPAFPDEAYVIAYHQAVRQLQESNIGPAQDFLASLPPHDVGHQLMQFRLLLEAEPELAFARKLSSSGLAEAIAQNPGPHRAWWLEYYCLVSYMEYYLLDRDQENYRRQRSALNQTILDFSLDVNFHPGIAYALSHMLGDAREANDRTENLARFGTLAKLARETGESIYAMEVLLHEGVLANKVGDFEKILQLRDEMDRIVAAQGEKHWLRANDWLLQAIRCLRGLTRVGNLEYVREQTERISKHNRLNPLRGYRNLIVLEKVNIALREWSVADVQRFLHHLPKENLEDQERPIALSEAFLHTRFGHTCEQPLIPRLQRAMGFAETMQNECIVALELLRLRDEGPSAAWWKAVRAYHYQAEIAPNPLELVQWLWVEFDGLLAENTEPEELVRVLRQILREASPNYILDHEVARLLLAHFSSGGRMQKSPRSSNLDRTFEAAEQVYRTRLASWPLATYCQARGLAAAESTRDLPPPPDTELQRALFQLLARDFGRTVEREAITRALWSEPYNPMVHDSRVQKVVAKLREHFEHYGHLPDEIEAVAGKGYRLRPRAEAGVIPLGHTRDRAILAWIERLPPDQWFSTAELARAFRQSPRQTQRDLQILLDAGRLESQGRARATRYRLARGKPQAA